MRKLGLFLSFLFLSISFALPQSNIVELEQKRKETLTQIEETQKILSQTKHDENSSFSQLQELNLQIEQRNTLLLELQTELEYIGLRINEIQLLQEALQKDLKELKDEYGRLVFAAYKNENSYEKLQFLFSSQTFSQLLSRVEYFQQYAKTRQYQIRQIEKVQEQLLTYSQELVEKQALQQTIFDAEKKEQEELFKLKGKQDNVLKGLKNKVGKLEVLVKQQEKLRDSYKSLINKEEAKSNKEAKDLANTKENTSKSDPVTSKESNTSKEIKVKKDVVKEDFSAENISPIKAYKSDTELSSAFRNKKGKLIFPTKNAVIVSRYGKYALDSGGLQVENLGIELRTNPDAEVFAVFDGKVSAVTKDILGSNYVVVVTHGIYYTVYSNLSSVDVKVGQIVTERTRLGQVGLNEDKVPQFQFQVWEHDMNKNPEQWLRTL